MEILALVFDSPLMSFGAPIVDRHGKTSEFPSRSMITGLLGNALGYDHSDVGKLARLQERLVLAFRQDCPGERIIDYQTVDLGQEHMRDNVAWTTWGRVDARKGGPSVKGTHERYRHYIADGVVVGFVVLEPPAESPHIRDVEEALRKPARPLFIGRKCCLPSRRIFNEIIEGESLLQVLKNYPLQCKREHHTAGEDSGFIAQWPNGEDNEIAMTKLLTDERDWENQVHCGQRLIKEGRIKHDKHRER